MDKMMSHSQNKSWYSLHNMHSPRLLYNCYNTFHHHDNPMDMFQNSHMVNTPNHYHSIHYYMYNWTMGMYWMTHYRILHNIFYQMYNNWYCTYTSH